MGQTTSPPNSPGRLVPLPMDPPRAILESIPAGSLPGTQVLHLSISLTFADPAGVQAFVNAVSDPKSAMYRKFITPDEVGRRFGPSPAAIQKVANYLTAQGMNIHMVAKNHLAILADATVAQAQAAFQTSIESFVSLQAATTASSAESAPLFSYTTTPSVPAELGPYVGYIGGLENFTRPKPLGTPVTPADFRKFYGVAPLYGASAQGQGRTIAISNFDGFRLANVAGWYSSWSLPTPSGGVGSNITDEVPSGDTSGGNGTPQGEGDLDIQCALAMAPLSNLIIYDAGSGSNDLIGVLTLEANDNKADIVTESYGWSGPSSFYAAAHNLHLSMSAQGMTYMAASGDSGTTSLSDTPYPDIDPEVLVVGGTTTNTDGSGNLTGQTGWSGSGGGWDATTDAFNTLPSYQKGTGVPTNIPYRLSPDVALNADPNTGYYIYLQTGELGVGAAGLYAGIGGTSAASPTFAGSLADAEQQLIANGGLTANQAGKHRFGRIQDLLYSFDGATSVFTSITSGSNGTLPNGQPSEATAGWNFVTGWGVINFDNLVLAESDHLTQLTVSPTSAVGGSGTTVTGTVTIASPAPAGGLTVSLTSSNSAAASVPTTVSVASGATSAPFTLTTSSVASSAIVTLTAALYGVSETATLTVTPPTLSGLALNPSTIVGGSPSTGTVTLAEPAPVGGLTVSLASDNASAATTPSTTTIVSGQTTGAFTVTTLAVTANATAHITATLNGTTETSTLNVTPPAVTGPAVLTGLNLGASSLYGYTEATGTVTLSTAAPAGGARILLTVSNASLAEVSTSALTIPSGSSSGTFIVLAKPVDAAATVYVKATYASISKQAGVTVRPSVLLSIAVTPSTPMGGVDTVTATVNLNEPAGPSGITVPLTGSPSAALTLSASSVFIPAGKKSATITASTHAVAANTNATIAGVFGVTKDAPLIVLAASLTSFAFNTNKGVGGASSITGTVTLNGPAGPSARAITLLSSDPSVVTLPASVAIPAGATSATFTFTPNPVKAETSVTITTRLGGVAKTQTITVTP